MLAGWALLWLLQLWRALTAAPAIPIALGALLAAPAAYIALGALLAAPAAYTAPGAPLAALVSHGRRHGRPNIGERFFSCISHIKCTERSTGRSDCIHTPGASLAALAVYIVSCLKMD